MFKKIAIIIIVLTVVVGVAGYIYYQRNIYSKEILRLEIIAKENVELLEEVEYTVRYRNNGNVRLEEPELVFNFPNNAILEEGKSSRIVKKADDLGGVIYPGQEKTFTFKARLVGQEGDIGTAEASLSYRPKNLRARYRSETSFASVIQRVPLNFDIDLPSRVDSGRELKFRLNYFSNIDYPVSNLKVMIDYPREGFEYISSTPRSLEKVEWDVGLLNRSEGGRIEITGMVFGDAGEEKIFRARLGSWIDGEFIVLKEAVRGINIARPSLHITQQINNNPKYVANPGDLLYYEVFFKNIGEEPLTDIFLRLDLVGSAFDFSTIEVPEGDFAPGNNSIIWDSTKVSDLRFLPAQSEGKVEFWVRLKKQWPINTVADKNPEIRSRVFLSQAREEFTNKINSKLALSQKGFFQDGIFGNSGPVPPEVGQTTSYTITWQLENYYNDVRDVKVKAILPQNVSLSSKIFPEEQLDRITFDSVSREIVWNVGDLVFGQGVLSQAPSISFQVNFNPTEDQRGEIAQLISPARIIGQDHWTGEVIQSAASYVDTSLPHDNSVSHEAGIVQ